MPQITKDKAFSISQGCLGCLCISKVLKTLCDLVGRGSNIMSLNVHHTSFRRQNPCKKVTVSRAWGLYIFLWLAFQPLLQRMRGEVYMSFGAIEKQPTCQKPLHTSLWMLHNEGFHVKLVREKFHTISPSLLHNEHPQCDLL